MASALATRLVRDSRTSFGDPVLPEVDSSRARSGCSSCGGAVAVLDDAVADDHVGVVGVDDRAVWSPPAGTGSTTWPPASAPR